MIPGTSSNTRRRIGFSRDAVRTLNRKALFDEVVMRGPISRLDLALELSLSRTAVADMAAELLERKLIRESGQGESAGGRRPTLLEAYSDSAYAIGIQVTADSFEAVAADPGGRQLVARASAVPAGATGAAILDAVTEIAQNLRAEVDPDGELQAPPVGIAWSGLVASDGSVTSPDIPSADDQPLNMREPLARQLGVPVVVDNDANMGALAELRHGAGRSRRNLVYILAHSGLGAGIVADGELYRGHCGAAGEIGHMLFDPTGERCECGNYGCIETVASARGLVRFFDEGVRLGRSSELASAPDAGRSVTAAAIIGAAERNDPAALAAVGRVAECLGVAAANAANAYAPEIVTLGGPLAVEAVLPQMQAIARQRTLAPLESGVQFEISALGGRGPAIGAAAAALEELVLATVSADDGPDDTEEQRVA